MIDINNYSFRGKNVLIRVDFNVPVNEKQKVTDDSRIVAAIPTIKSVVDSGGSAILISHRGRPKNNLDKHLSMRPISKHLEKLIKKDVVFINNCCGGIVEKKIMSIPKGSVVMLENLRFHKGETMGDIYFAKKLSLLGDFFINDAFGTAHRAHASTFHITKFFKNRCLFGHLMNREIEMINKALNSPQKPFTAIVGGAKISSKIGVLTSLIKKVDNLIIGGAMAYTFIKSMGGNVGGSLVEDDKIDLALKIIEDASYSNCTLHLPVDSLNTLSLNDESNVHSSDIKEIKNNLIGVDIGPKTIKIFSDIISASKTILWNGPMGVFEKAAFSKGTSEITNSVSSATKNGAFSLVGGGDSVAAIKLFSKESSVSYISTGGGATLEYIENFSLPGIEAVMKSFQSI